MNIFKKLNDYLRGFVRLKCIKRKERKLYGDDMDSIEVYG